MCCCWWYRKREASRKRRKEIPLIKDEERIFLVQIKNFSKLENAIVREVVIWCLAVRNTTHNNEGKGEEWLESVWECGMRYDVSGWKCYFNLFTRSSSSSKQVIYEGKMFILLYSIAEISIRKLSKLIAFTWYKPSNFEFIKIIKMLSTGLNF